MDSKTKLTTEAGIPVGDELTSINAAGRGPSACKTDRLFPRIDDPSDGPGTEQHTIGEKHGRKVRRKRGQVPGRAQDCGARHEP